MPMSSADLVFALVALPLLGAALALMAKSLPSASPLGRVLEAVGAFVGLALPWAVLALSLDDMLAGVAYRGIIGGWNPSVGIAYRFDGLAWMLSLLGYALAGAAYIYTLGKGPRGPAFTAIFLIQTAALAATSMTADLFNLFVCLEILGIASYVLVASSRKPGAYLAAFSYLMVSATAMIFFLLGIYGFYRLTGSLSYEGIRTGLAALPDGGGLGSAVSLSAIAGAVAIRVAVMPVYGWLPDAHALAPHGISAVLSGVLIKTPLFALTRVLLIMPGVAGLAGGVTGSGPGAAAGELLGYAGAVTALAAVIIALSQSDAKRLLAYHSVSQIGYVVAAWGAAFSVGVGTPAGARLMAAAFLHALFHALFKGLLFLSVGSITDAAGERDVYRLRSALLRLREAGDRFGLSAFAFFTGAFSIAALPPFNGFVSKNLLSYALKDGWQYYLLYAAALGTVASFIKLSMIFAPAAKGQNITEGQSAGEAPAADRFLGPGALSAQTLLAIACVITGLAGPAIFRQVILMFSSGATSGAGYPAVEIQSPGIWSASNFLTAAIISAGGAVLYMLTRTPAISNMLRRIRRRRRAFHGLFLSFTLGTLALAFYLWSSL
jgi:formate hydrogenlyase subunit 3/multisubunit Na+/H+ antiporter MnhD subunit